MKKSVITIFTVIIILAFFAFKMMETYPEQVLIQPEELAKILNDAKAKQPYIFNMGSTPMIKNAISGGMGYSDEAMKELKIHSSSLDKNNLVVLYCGCCKLENCPNVKLPYDFLKQQGFKNVKILNLETDLQTDWVGKGYPMKGVK